MRHRVGGAGYPGGDIPLPHYGEPLDDTAEGDYHRLGTPATQHCCTTDCCIAACCRTSMPWALIFNPSWAAVPWAPSCH